MFSLLYGRGRCCASSEKVQNLWFKTQAKEQKQAIEALLMHM